MEVFLPFPVSINRKFMYKSSKVLTPEYRGFMDEVGWLTKKFRPVTEGYVAVAISLHWTGREPDVDNYCKALLDALEGRMYVNDRQVNPLLVTKTKSEGKAYCMVVVSS